MKKPVASATGLFSDVCHSAREVRCAREVDLRSVKCLRAWVVHFTSLCGFAAKLHGERSEPLHMRRKAHASQKSVSKLLALVQNHFFQLPIRLRNTRKDLVERRGLFSDVCHSAREVRCAREVDLQPVKCLRAGVARFASLCCVSAKLHGEQSEALHMRRKAHASRKLRFKSV